MAGGGRDAIKKDGACHWKLGLYTEAFAAKVGGFGQASWLGRLRGGGK